MANAALEWPARRRGRGGRLGAGEARPKAQAGNATAGDAAWGEHLAAAMELVAHGSVRPRALDPRGLLSVEVEDRACRVRLHPDGTFDAGSCACRHQGRCVHRLAAVLWVARQAGQSRSPAPVRSLIAEGPEWLGPGYRLTGSIAGAPAHTVPVRGLRTLGDLQAYWMLMDLCPTGKGRLPPDLLARQVLARYGAAPWRVQRAALEAILRRLGSAEREALSIVARPARGRPLGRYRVRAAGRGARTYEVLLAGVDAAGGGADVAGTVSRSWPAGPIDGSCACPDFEKSTLGVCKHLGAVLRPWYRSATAVARLARETLPAGAARLRFIAEPGLDGPVDALRGLRLERAPGAHSAAADTLARLLAAPGVARARPGARPGPDRPRDRLDLVRALEAAVDAARSPSAGCVVDPAVAPVLRREEERLAWRVEWPLHRRRLERSLGRLQTALYAYQREGVLRALERGRLLLGDDMGLGKTVQGIAWAEALLGAGLARTVVVVCPAALKSQWRREWERCARREDVCVVDGGADERARAYRRRPAVLIVNYELVLRDIEALVALAPEAVILDEAQRMKNYATRTARTIKRLAPRFRLVLTGTPMENRLEDLSSLMDWIDDDALGPSWRLASAHTLSDGAGHGRTGVGALAALRARLAPHFLRRVRAEVARQLPPRTDTPLHLPMTEAQTEVHAELAARAARIAARAARRPLTPEEYLNLMALLARMRIVANGLAQYEYERVWPTLLAERDVGARVAALDSPKLCELRSVVEGLLAQPGLKVVVFSQWQRMLRLAHWAVADVLRAHGAEAVFFTGAENARRRTENVVRFHDEPHVRFFFATDAGGVGLNLQRAASACINLELPWNPAVLEQRVGRVYRLGQTEPVQAFHLITEGSIEQRITELVRNKRAVFEGLFDGTTDEVRFEAGGTFLGQVRQVMAELAPRAGKSDAEGAEELEEAEIADTVAEEDAATGAERTDPLASASLGPREAAEAAEAAEATTDGGRADPTVGAVTPVPAASAALELEHVRRALREVRVERNADGALRIEASGNAAHVLAELFGGMARLLAG